MRALILSCNTGEGHNAAGRAIKEALEKDGHEAVMLDYMKLSSDRTSKVVGDAYINIAKYTPGFFHLLYKAGMLITSSKRKSPVYYANKLMAKPLKRYLDDNNFDIIVMPHLYPAETLTYMKKKKMLTAKTIAIDTDYTCIPFWEETNCDAYVVPNEIVMEEYIKRGVPREKLYPLGIPVKERFIVEEGVEEARRKLNLNPFKPVYLIMSGSMGFGKIQLFTFELNKRCTEGEQIVVICGNNKKLKKVMEKGFNNIDNIHIIGYTEEVPSYMAASDVIYTKPGGLTSTEVMVKNRPLVHTSPIPGCETSNMEFFMKEGMCVHSKKIRTQIEQGKALMYDEELKKRMLESQGQNAKKSAAKDIVDLMKNLIKERA